MQHALKLLFTPYSRFNRIELTAKFLPLLSSCILLDCCRMIRDTLRTPRLGVANLLTNRLSRRHGSRGPAAKPF